MLTVVTHTQFQRPELLERCKTSVAAALPPHCYHAVIECNGDWAQARYDAMQLDEFVAFVDDDDTIHPDALRLCLDAIQNFNCGLAVTDQAMVDLEGNVIRNLVGPKSYRGITLHPRTAHHLCVIRTAVIDRGPLELHQQFGLGIDWFLKGCAALGHGAVHVPMIGYQWTQHPESMTSSSHLAFNASMASMGQALAARYPRQDSVLPKFSV